jgi:thymidylate synthase
MNKIDNYIRETLLEILEDGQWDKEPRTKWSNGEVAHSKFITQKVFQYNISKGEYPITTLRTTALRGAWEDINTIYLKQTNILEEMHSSIQPWWKDFCKYDSIIAGGVSFKDNSSNVSYKTIRVLGYTYGHTVKRYDLVNKLLRGLEENPFGRRHSVNLNQEQQKIDDPSALQPCAFETLWSVREERLVIQSEDKKESYSMDIWDMSNMTSQPVNTRYIDLTLIQRSQDYCATSCINSIQYVMLGIMVCNHLTFKTGIKHELGKFMHVVQNIHIYDRHEKVVEEILDRKPTGKQPKVKLICEPKDFYSHTFEDFEFEGLEGIQKLENKIEIAV